MSREKIIAQAGGPERGSEAPASCAIVRLEATVICDVDKRGLLISEGTTEKPWGGEEGRRAGTVATRGHGFCQHVTHYSTLVLMQEASGG